MFGRTERSYSTNGVPKVYFQLDDKSMQLKATGKTTAEIYDMNNGMPFGSKYIELTEDEIKVGVSALKRAFPDSRTWGIADKFMSEHLSNESYYVSEGVFADTFMSDCDIYVSAGVPREQIDQIRYDVGRRVLDCVNEARKV